MSTAPTTHYDQSPVILTVVPLLILFGAASALFWLSAGDPSSTYKYWEIFVPVVAVLSLFSGWGQCQATGNDRLWYFIRQFIHWGTVLGLIYVFNAVGFRELLSDQQYIVILIGTLAGATLLAAIQMDLKLVLFAFFLAFCAYLLFTPAENAALTSVGNLFRIGNAPDNAPMVVAALAGAGFIASLMLYAMVPKGHRRTRPAATATATEAATPPPPATPTGASQTSSDEAPAALSAGTTQPSAA
jgi:hypothetical protein